jgi:hypothetical protein
MTFGTGPQSLVQQLADHWTVTRSGRPDVPDATTQQRSEAGTVLLTNDRDVVANNQGVHDLVHCYHPQATGISMQDKGFDEQGATETVQIDIETTNRPDPDTGERLDARTRMVGDRSDPDFSTAISEGPYPGILGEVLYVLEAHTRLGFAEYDVARKEVINLQLYNSEASASVSVDLEWISVNTAE